MTVDRIEHVPCIQQGERECGPRTIVAIHDAIDQINDGYCTEHIFQRMASYDLTDDEFARHSRRWLYDLLYDPEFNMTTYNIPPSQVSCEPIEKYLHNCQKPIDGCRINEPQREVEPVPKPPTVPFPNPSTPTLSPSTHLPMQNVSCVLTHIIDDNNNIQYVYTRKTVTDDIVFLIAQPDVKELHKSD